MDLILWVEAFLLGSVESHVSGSLQTRESNLFSFFLKKKILSITAKSSSSHSQVFSGVNQGFLGAVQKHKNKWLDTKV